jgi:hypothetical protein
MRSVVGLLVLLVAAVGCKGPMQQNVPPAERMMEPGPGVGGPGPGVMMFQPATCAPPQTSQVYFVSPDGMSVTWATPGRSIRSPWWCLAGITSRKGPSTG